MASVGIQFLVHGLHQGVGIAAVGGHFVETKNGLVEDLVPMGFIDPIRAKTGQRCAFPLGMAVG